MSARVIELALAASLVLAAVIHLIPASGLLSVQRLHALYGLNLDDPTLVLLLRHRALLFGLLGTFFLIAAFVPAWRVAAAVVALLSMLSFIGLAGGQQWPAAIQRVVSVDVVVSGVLFVALAARLVTRALA